MTVTGYNRGTPPQIARQAAAILNVDAASNTATGMVRGEKPVIIDLSYHVGAIQLTPSRGEQWYIVQAPWPTPKPGVTWILDSKIPFNTPEITLPATEGQQQIGTGAGPIQLHGTQINANGPLRLANADSSLLDTIRRARRGDTGGGALPDAATVDNGSLAYGTGTPLTTPSTTTPIYSQDGQWIPLLGSGNVNISDLSQSFQTIINNTVSQAGSAFQLPTGGIPLTDLSSSVQDLLNGALQYSDISGTPASGDPVVSDGSGGLTWGTPGSGGGVSTSDWNSLLNLLFGAPVIGTILEAAIIPLLEIANISGLQTELNNLLDLTTWEDFLSQANVALGQAGSDVGHFILGLQNIPQGNVTGLVDDLASFLSLSTWNSFLTDANTALNTLGVDLPSLITGLENIPQSNVAGLVTDLGNLLGISTWETFLTDANAALGTGGSDLGHLILGLGSIPIGNITDLSTYTQYFNNLGQYDASQLFNLANIPAIAISRITNLTGYLGNLNSSGVLSLAGLAAGALPGGITLDASGLTGLATGIATWLISSGALPAAATVAGAQLTGSVDASLINGVTANEQIIADQIFGAANQNAGQALTQIQSALQQFPFGNLAGSPGATGTGPLQGLADTMLQGLTNLPVVGNTLANVSNFLSGMANQLYGYTPASPPLESVAGTTTANSQTIAQMTNTRSVSHAIAPTGDATFDLALLTGATIPTLAVTQGNSVIGFIRTPTGGNPNIPMTLWPTKQAVAWKSTGYSGSITALFINIYKYNTVTGIMDLYNQSPNLVATIANSLNFYFYTIIPDQPYLPSTLAFQGIPYAQTDVFAVEMVIVGTGTYNLAGLTLNHASYPGVLPPYMAAYRGNGTTVPSPPEELIPGTHFFYQTPTKVPWFSLTGSSGATTYAPQQAPFITAGSFTYTIPTWAQFIDYAICPGGGGGGGGVNAWGNGGSSGNWIYGTLQVGGINGPPKSTPLSPSQITGVVGGGGAPGSSEYYLRNHTEYLNLGGSQSGTDASVNYAAGGGSGGASSIAFTSPSGAINLAAPGGLGGVAGGGSYPGQAMPTQTYNGGTYYGGVEQDGESLQNGSAPAYNGYGGNAPGGGGAGCYSGSGNTLTTDYYDGVVPPNHWYVWEYGVNGAQQAGAGAPGAVFLVAYAPNIVPPASVPYAPVQGQINVAIPRAATR